jgi:hypothetical protein
MFNHKVIPLGLPFIAYLISACVLLFMVIPNAMTHDKRQVGWILILFVAYAILSLAYGNDLLHLKMKHELKKMNPEYFKKSLFDTTKSIAYGLILFHFTCMMVGYIPNTTFKWYYFLGFFGYIALITKQTLGALLLGLFFVVSVFINLDSNMYTLFAKALLASYYTSLFFYIQERQ